MKQRQFNLGTKRQSFMDEDLYVRRHRFLSSWNDESRLATERELIINQLSDHQFSSSLAHPKRDFSSCHYIPGNNNRAPLFASSHAGPHPTTSNNNVFNVYSSRISWPHFKTTKSELETDDDFKCSCGNCKTESGPTIATWRMESSGKSGARDNIMRFSDKETMTPKYGNACCGTCQPLPSNGKTSEASMTTAERSRKGKAQMQQTSAPPILKKTRVSTDSCCGENCCQSVRPSQNKNEDTPYENPQGCCCMQTQDKNQNCKTKDKNQNGKSKEKKSKQDSKGSKQPKVKCRCPKNLYDRDLISNVEEKRHYCKCLELSTKKGKSSRNSSKTSIKSCGSTRRTMEDSGGLPFSHRQSSKYHTLCRESPVIERYHCELRKASPVKKDEDGKCQPPCNPMCQQAINCRICLPRRVLTSEQDIEYFLGKDKQRSRSRSRSPFFDDYKKWCPF